MEGCKNSCIYCNQHLLKGHRVQDRDLNVFITEQRKLFKNKDNMELALYGGTFFNISEARRDFFRNKIIELKKLGLISRARCSTSPESISEKILNEFKGVIDCVELGVQSMDDYVLSILGRRYSSKDVTLALNLLKNYGFESGIQLMVGLPFESSLSHVKTTDAVAQIKPDFVRLYPLFIPKRTLLSLYYNLGFFNPPDFDELLWRLAYSFIRFTNSHIRIVRIGLTSFIDKEDIDFMHHEADFRGAVLSYIYFNLLLQGLKKQKRSEVLCNVLDYQYITGVRRSNVKRLNSLSYLFDIRISDIERYSILIDGKRLGLSDLKLTI